MNKQEKKAIIHKANICVKYVKPVAKNGLISAAENHNNRYISAYYFHSQITLIFLYAIVFRMYLKDDSDFVCDFCSEFKLINQKRRSTQISLLHNDSQKLKLDLILEKRLRGCLYDCVLELQRIWAAFFHDGTLIGTCGYGIN